MTDILLANAALLGLTMTALWLYCVKIKDVSVIDSFWAFGMVLLAANTYLLADGGNGLRKALLLGLTAVWGLRLSIHLFVRWRAHGIDPRYAAIMGRLIDKKGMSFASASFIHVFAMQAGLLFVVCLPAVLGQISPTPEQIGLLGWIGVGVAITGIAFETIGDAQLNAFRKDPAMKGKVLETGLWRYTRHPNYFGDACTWWGIWLISAETPLGLWALPGPLLITWLLTRLSGVPMLEHRLRKHRPGYEAYVARTSGFFPLPPKKD